MTRKRAIGKFLDAFGEVTWTLRVIPSAVAEPVQGFEEPIPLAFSGLSADELRSRIPFCSKMNSAGYEVYAQPERLGFVLIDDITREAGDTLKKSACAIVSTSQGNLQAWVRLGKEGISREEHRDMSVRLAERFAGDLQAATNPEQCGRLPGFTNNKPKYCRNGVSPLVYLVWSNSKNYLQGAILSPSAVGVSDFASRGRRKEQGQDRSKIDCAAAFSRKREGLSCQEIVEWLMVHSSKRPGDLRYCESTARFVSSQ